MVVSGCTPAGVMWTLTNAVLVKPFAEGVTAYYAEHEAEVIAFCAAVPKEWCRWRLYDEPGYVKDVRRYCGWEEFEVQPPPSPKGGCG